MSVAGNSFLRGVCLGCFFWLQACITNAQVLSPLSALWQVRCLAVTDCHEPVILGSSSDSLSSSVYVHALRYGCNPLQTMADGYAHQYSKTWADSIWIYQLSLGNAHGADSLTAMGTCDGYLRFQVSHQCELRLHLEFHVLTWGGGAASLRFALTQRGSAGTVVDSLSLQSSSSGESGPIQSRDRRLALQPGDYELSTHTRGESRNRTNGGGSSFLLVQLRLAGTTQVANSTWTAVKDFYR
jgi:hypothetical protein